MYNLVAGTETLRQMSPHRWIDENYKLFHIFKYYDAENNKTKYEVRIRARYEDFDDFEDALNFYNELKANNFNI